MSGDERREENPMVIERTTTDSFQNGQTLTLMALGGSFMWFTSSEVLSCGVLDGVVHGGVIRHSLVRVLHQQVSESIPKFTWWLACAKSKQTMGVCLPRPQIPLSLKKMTSGRAPALPFWKRSVLETLPQRMHNSSLCLGKLESRQIQSLQKRRQQQ